MRIIDIADPDDPRIDDYRHLNSSDRRPDLPGGKGLVIAEGVLVVRRMLASRFAPRSLMGTEKRRLELERDLDGTAVPFYRVHSDVMEQCIGFHLNRGVLAAADRVPDLALAEVLDGARTVAVLEGVNDHENIGALFRNAAGLGVDAVVFGKGCADPLYRRAVRVSMGHVLRTPWTRAGEWPDAVTRLREHGFTVAALTPDPAAPPLADALAGKGDARMALVVGAEGPGLREKTMRLCDVRARVPMSEGTDSLNVATAAAVAFYERSRAGE